MCDVKKFHDPASGDVIPSGRHPFFSANGGVPAFPGNPYLAFRTLAVSVSSITGVTVNRIIDSHWSVNR